MRHLQKLDSFAGLQELKFFCPTQKWMKYYLMPHQIYIIAFIENIIRVYYVNMNQFVRI